MHQTSGRWRLGLLLALVAVLTWGILPIALKALLEAMDAYTVTWYRFLIAALLLGGWLAATERLPRTTRLSRLGWGLLVIAAIGLYGNYILYLLGLDRVSPGAAQIVIQTAPLFMLLGGLVVFRERFRLSQWLGLAVLVAGLALYFNDRLALLFSAGDYGTGVVLVLVAAVTWAVYALAQKQLLTTLSSTGIMWLIYSGAVVALLPAAKPAAVLELGAPELALLAFCSANTLIAYGSFAEALDHWDASRIGAVLALTPLATLLFMELVTRLAPGFVEPEALNALSWLGALLVVAGSMVAALSGAD